MDKRKVSRYIKPQIRTIEQNNKTQEKHNNLEFNVKLDKTIEVPQTG